MDKWIVSPIINGNYILDDSLKNEIKEILITYSTRTGRRYVKQVLCEHGRVSKKLNGEIIAWQPLPEPYNE